MPITATTASTARASAAGAPKPSNPAPLSTAATFAQVATLTQPRYSPKVPSTRSRSSSPPAGRVVVRWKSSPRTASSAAITSTLSHSSPAWMVSSQAAFSSSEAIAGTAMPRASAGSHHCHRQYAPSPT